MRRTSLSVAMLFPLASAGMAQDVPIPRLKPVVDSNTQPSPGIPQTPSSTAQAAKITAPRPRPKPTDTAPPAVIAKPDQPKQNIPPFNLAAARKCEAALSRLNVTFTVAPDIEADGICGAQRPLKLTRLGRQIEATGGPMMRCEVALALAHWTRDVVMPSAKLHLNDKLESIQFSTSYQCRRRNNAPSGKYSEHAFANALDITGFTLKETGPVPVQARQDSAAPARAFQAASRGGACAYFTTVIGPMTNAAHADHLHLDLAVRRSGYRLCQ